MNVKIAPVASLRFRQIVNIHNARVKIHRCELELMRCHLERYCHFELFFFQFILFCFSLECSVPFFPSKLPSANNYLNERLKIKQKERTNIECLSVCVFVRCCFFRGLSGMSMRYQNFTSGGRWELQYELSKWSGSVLPKFWPVVNFKWSGSLSKVVRFFLKLVFSKKIGRLR